ncbi:MAG: right-handed parallel beta-helix repeat-containing protein, partial [Planctomycetaceae bacterium]
MRVSQLLILVVLTGACRAEGMPGKGRNSAAVAEVAAGRFTVANASWWGFDREDATAALQQAINSKASKVIVPFMGSPWIVRPIELRSHLELVFEPGVVVLARKGEFRERWDCLFSAITKSDITMRGSGTIFRMRKRDYRNPPYPPKEEWKHVVKGEGVRRMMLEGLQMESSGGDGIYFGSDSVRGSEDIVIRNCVSFDNHRQGISLTDIKNLLVENCVFKGTEGTGPSAGVDYEPDRTQGKLVNCIFRNCLFEDNAGHGMFVRANDFRSDTSEPISIRFENCTSRMSQPGTGGDCGMCVRVPGDEGPEGTIEFINCLSENAGQAGASVYGVSVGNLKIRFVNCNWINSQGTAVVLNMQKPSDKGTGSIEFVNCSVHEEKTTPTVQVITLEGNDYDDDVTGTITVRNTHGARLASEPPGVNVNLLIVNSITGATTGNASP